MNNQKNNQKLAIQVWNNYFKNKNKDKYLDPFEREIFKQNYQAKTKNNGWVLDYIIPIELGGKNELNNMIPVNRKSKEERNNKIENFVCNKNTYYIDINTKKIIKTNINTNEANITNNVDTNSVKDLLNYNKFAHEVWKKIYKDETIAFDKNNLQVNKNLFNSKKEFGWILSFIIPLEDNGKDDIDNLEIISNFSNINLNNKKLLVNDQSVAYKYWNQFIGKKVKEYFDFSGRIIKKQFYNSKKSEYSWNLDYIVPLDKGGKDVGTNLIIINCITKLEKSNLFPDFFANNKKFFINIKNNEIEEIIDKKTENEKYLDFEKDILNNNKKAMEIWEIYFKNKNTYKDFNNIPIKKGNFNCSKEQCWKLDYIIPIENGGKRDINNLRPVSNEKTTSKNVGDNNIKNTKSSNNINFEKVFENNKEACIIWDNYFKDKNTYKDYKGININKGFFKCKEQKCWEIEYIIPLEQGGKKDINNLRPVSVFTKLNKENKIVKENPTKSLPITIENNIYNIQLKLWDLLIGIDKERYTDIAGRLILKKEYNTNSLYSWNIDHIKPKAKNGNSNIDNLQIVNVKTNQEKGHDYPFFKANNKSFYINENNEIFELINTKNKDINIIDYYSTFIYIRVNNCIDDKIINFIKDLYIDGNFYINNKCNIDFNNLEKSINTTLIYINYYKHDSNLINEIYNKIIILNTYLNNYFLKNNLIQSYDFFVNLKDLKNQFIDINFNDIINNLSDELKNCYYLNNLLINKLRLKSNGNLFEKYNEVNNEIKDKIEKL